MPSWLLDTPCTQCPDSKEKQITWSHYVSLVIGHTHPQITWSQNANYGDQVFGHTHQATPTCWCMTRENLRWHFPKASWASARASSREWSSLSVCSRCSFRLAMMSLDARGISSGNLITRKPEHAFFSPSNSFCKCSTCWQMESKEEREGEMDGEMEGEMEGERELERKRFK